MRSSGRWLRPEVLVFGAVALAGWGAFVASAPQALAAGQQETVLINEPFTGSSLPAGTPLVNLDGSCLTADPNTHDVPIPGCQNPAIDANGQGVLQLTPAVNGAKGGLLYSNSLPTADGLDVHFTQYQYGGNGADGIGFVVASAPPTPNTVGVAGGGLGYANLQGGYLGIGFDTFGNYLNPLTSGAGCAQPAWVPNNPPWNTGNAISVRGPGTSGAGEGTGYCILTSNFDPTYGLGGPLPGSLRGASRANGARQVHVVLDAEAKTYSVSVDFTGTGSAYTPVIKSAPLPKPIPPRITFGFSASTGGLNDVHAISNLDVSTFNRRAGHWLAGADGGVFAFATGFYGSAGGHPLSKPVVGMAATPDRQGYWLVAADGGVFSFGDAGFYGSTGGHPPGQPVVGMAATPDGLGYWLVAADGALYRFGDAGSYGSAAGQPLSKPVVGMAATPDGLGYWLVGADGGVFSFGDAGFYGSTGGRPLSKPVIGIAPSPTGFGYWLVASDGGVFTFGDAGFYGSIAGVALTGPIVGVSPG